MIKKTITGLAIISFIIFVIYSCVKEQNCNLISGTWKLSKVIENGNVKCTYDSSFYYTYTFNDDKVLIKQYRNSVDSILGEKDVYCIYIYKITEDSFRYGDITNYGLLIK